MTPQEVDEMRVVFDIVTKTLALREAELSVAKALLTRAAEALETLLLGIDAVYVCTDTAIQEDSEKLMECVSAYEPLIAELRKAAQ